MYNLSNHIKPHQCCNNCCNWQKSLQQPYSYYKYCNIQQCHTFGFNKCKYFKNITDVNHLNTKNLSVIKIKSALSTASFSDRLCALILSASIFATIGSCVGTQVKAITFDDDLKQTTNIKRLQLPLYHSTKDTIFVESEPITEQNIITDSTTINQVITNETIYTPPIQNWTKMDVPTTPDSNTGQKTYMDYRTITNKTSAQYALQQQPEVWTDELGLRRYGNYYMCAMGTYYGFVGDVFRITVSSGNSFEIILGDIKSDLHTDELHQHKNGNIVEFIVDQDKLSSTVRTYGDISKASPLFEGTITNIEKLIT